MGKFARSWALLKASFDVLAHERKLLVFPLVSSLCMLLVLASFALPVAWSTGLFASLQQMDVNAGGVYWGWYVLLFAFYLVQYGVAIFFNTALVDAALVHLDGGHPTVRGSLGRAWSRLPQILGYAALAATVGVLLHALEERLGLLGRIVVGLIGAAWSVATFLVVPLLAATDVGPVDAVKDSVQMLKRTWGENLIGNAGLGIFGLLMGLGWIVLLVILIALVALTHSSVMLVLAILIGALSMAFIILVQAALKGVYAAALYRFASAGEVGGQFDSDLLGQAFRTRRKRRF